MSLPHSADLDSSDRAQPATPQTQCALLTGTGRSAVAVIGLRGPDASRIIDHFFVAASTKPLRSGQIRYGNWLDGKDEPGEAVVITPIGVHHYEIHCHGGPAAIERILGHLRESRVQPVDSFTWHRDEYRLIHEARQVLARCLTARTAAIALAQVNGALADWTKRWIDMLAGPTGAISKLHQEAAQILASAPLTIRLSEPFRVVLVGPPNVGKSSLINAIVGYDRSITDATAGTTRDVINVDTVIDGLPIRLSDTAGLRESSESIEREGIARAQAAAKSADLILRVTAAQPTTSVAMIEPESMVPPTAGQLSVLNKIDRLSPATSIPTGTLPTNALTGDGIPELIQSIGRQLEKSLPAASNAVVLTPRQADAVGHLVHVSTPEQAIRELHQLLHGVVENDRSAMG